MNTDNTTVETWD